MRWWIVVAGWGLTACSGSPPAPANAVEPSLTGLRDFDAITLDSGDSVEVRQGADYAVRIEGPIEARNRMSIRRDGNTLRIGRREHGLWTVDRGAVRIVVMMPVIRAATLAGSGDVTIDQASDPFVATLSGSGDMTIGQLQGDRTTLTVSGTGTIAAAGSVRAMTLTVTVTGSGDIDARQVQATEAVVSVTGSGDVAATINGVARVSLVGSGSATLGPGARCVVQRVGTGEAHCG
ncbi:MULTISPECIES: head GIN domain-containing protein [unclassified Sphingomonas]|uniref:head GIN domain-containing protein n=1 Tax=unclassified Sphingomonas TaxID=196159 RepID=UPI000A76D224|nr:MULTISPECIES: head GIN domain-containing protein [unclassified Sphingomonas]